MEALLTNCCLDLEIQKMTLICIVHYPNQATYSRIKQLSEVNKRRVIEAKEKRLSLGGSNSHLEQCENVPSEFEDSIHGVHLQPCYKKYVTIVCYIDDTLHVNFFHISNFLKRMIIIM